MKYNYNDTWNDLQVKVSDTLPVGTIVDYDGATVPDGYEQVASYSTDEVKTGDTWIDGKPIYRIVLNFTTTAGVSNSPTISNVSKILSFDGAVRQSSGNYSSLSYRYNDTDWCMCFWYAAQNCFQFRTGTSYGFGDTTMIVEYTKTTD